MAIRDDITADDQWFLGEDKALDFTLFQVDSVTPLDITDEDLVFALYWPSTPASAALWTKVTPVQIDITNGPGGLCTVNVVSADTVAMAAGTYAFVLRRVADALVLSHGQAVLRDPTAVDGGGGGGGGDGSLWPS